MEIEWKAIFFLVARYFYGIYRIPVEARFSVPVQIGPGTHPASYTSVSQPPGRGPIPGPGFNYIGPRDILLEFVILVF